MDTRVDEDAIRKLGKEIAKGIKTEADLGDFSKLLKKIVEETALDASSLIIWATTSTTPTAMALAIAATVNPRNDSRVIMVISVSYTHLTLPTKA